jgi:hypothetical protein
VSRGHRHRSGSPPSGSGPHCVRVATGSPITLLVCTARRSASGCGRTSEDRQCRRKRDFYCMQASLTCPTFAHQRCFRFPFCLFPAIADHTVANPCKQQIDRPAVKTISLSLLAPLSSRSNSILARQYDEGRSARALEELRALVAL